MNPCKFYVSRNIFWVASSSMRLGKNDGRALVERKINVSGIDNGKDILFELSLHIWPL